jgi:hypothetical protein
VSKLIVDDLVDFTKTDLEAILLKVIAKKLKLIPVKFYT